jgi:hypothetical protein
MSERDNCGGAVFAGAIYGGQTHREGILHFEYVHRICKRIRISIAIIPEVLRGAGGAIGKRNSIAFASVRNTVAEGCQDGVADSNSN